MPELIDVHCHIDDDAFGSDLDKVLENAKKVGVSCIVTSALDEKSIKKTEAIVEKYKGFVYCTVGLDYSLLDEEKVSWVMDYITKNKERIIGIGEVGLDFFIFRNDALQER